MPEKAVKIYQADISGPYRQPHPDSNVEPHNRVDFQTHELLNRAFSGPGLAPTFSRFRRILLTSLETSSVEVDWLDSPDLLAFIREHLGRAVLESLFGPTILSTNPTFMENLWMFDEEIPGLAKRLPKFLVPRAYKARTRLLCQIKAWYKFARENFEESKLDADGDGDPFWGSNLMRDRQKTLLSCDNQDDDAIAATDLGLIWA